MSDLFWLNVPGINCNWKGIGSLSHEGNNQFLNPGMSRDVCYKDSLNPWECPHWSGHTPGPRWSVDVLALVCHPGFHRRWFYIKALRGWFITIGWIKEGPRWYAPGTSLIYGDITTSFQGWTWKYFNGRNKINCKYHVLPHKINTFR